MFLAPAVLICLLGVVVYTVPASESKTVVSIPFPFTSHCKYHASVARSLTKRGHQVWLALPSYITEKGHIDTSGFRVIHYDTSPDLQENLQEALAGSYFKYSQWNIFEAIAVARSIFDMLLKNDSFFHTIDERSPDLLVIDNCPWFYVMSVIAYRLGVPFAFLGPFYYPPLLRIPYSTADLPLALLPFSDRMTFLERSLNTLVYLIFSVYNPIFPNDAVSVYAPEMKYLPLDALVSKAEIFILTIDHVLDYPKPTLPNVKLIGGIAAGPAKPLPHEFQAFMDNAKDGVVIVSFGSYVLNVPKHISDKIFHVLLQLPFKSVFRSDLPSPDLTKIMTAPWIPQNDLLGHPHTKVFLSHCGNDGQYEALYHAVPIVATPLFLDQHYDAERVRVKGFAEVLDLNACTAEEMMLTIMTVANNPEYKQAVVKHSRLFKELYGTPKETAAYWLDHVMEYGGDYMRSGGQQMPAYQFALMDVYLFFGFVLLLSFTLVCMSIKIVRRCMCDKKAKTE